jgi:uncharacterized protein YukE
MADVRLNPDDLDSFAAYLIGFSAELKDGTGNLLGHLRELGNTWEDAKYGAFADELERNARAYLEKFDEIAEQVITELKRKAERAREVHR